MIRIASAIMAASGIFTMCQGDPAPTVHHGDRLDVIMQPAPDWVAQCNNMGGEPIQYPSSLRVCESVDF